MPHDFSQKPPDEATQESSGFEHQQSNRSRLYQKYDMLSKIGGRNDERVIDDLGNRLDFILKKSQNYMNDRGTGARSLFSTCLALVPEYIMEEQETTYDISEECLSTTVYNQLEALFSPGVPGSGWQYLGEIVARHAILLLSHAIQDGFIGITGARRLMNISLGNGAKEAVSTLLESLLSRLGKVDSASEICSIYGSYDDTLGMLLQDFCRRTRNFHFACRYLGRLFEEQK